MYSSSWADVSYIKPVLWRTFEKENNVSALVYSSSWADVSYIKPVLWRTFEKENYIYNEYIMYSQYRNNIYSLGTIYI